ncbi:BirA family biotin operon repressor/biotin-[acetyl-CoA-carboxylase] ligase [Brevibacterium sanguinis]|uniref:BirA family biotin operon repressor/biotin-[acetyl-CoA-carboxylase] ligase n=2 Tax=Brevibacterium TaxID=1696 RepID=A0A366IN50_9MICO|nr:MULTISPECIES: biotin--[acetyl-CoA-carboxylase] ligase [Brevibacterium]RBP66118.1 BirA family biotin operon repressor/biotin-[acetyl-CoA-carboxylase] ligase [Brevibacterium sanguinis]RBP72769.1 BirA family biotin operon repressor/biotin-[acetyl-CoA-carboxylase] ligase [Brevibacterium celere]
MNSQHTSLLVDVDSVRAEARADGLDLPLVIWDESCSSTNDELAGLVTGATSLAAAAAGRGLTVSAAAGVDPSAPPREYTIRGTDHQNAGHGRLGRTWTVPPRRSLTFSILLGPGAMVGSWGWIPLLAGEAVRAAIAEAGVPAVLKWPNDVLTPAGDKLCGILARIESRAGLPQIVLGMGINTRLGKADLPRETASSLAIEKGTDGSEIDHGQLVVSVLRRFIPAYRELIDGGEEEFGSSTTAAAVRENMVTLGALVRVERPDGSSIVGRATGLDAGGDLVLDGDRTFSAGDVHHLRMAE